MPKPAPDDLTRRERQIMDIIYARGTTSVGEVLEALPDPPSYSAVRALLRILEDKGHLKHRKVGMKYVYQPLRAKRQAGRAVLRRVVNTFFEGSAEQTLLALMEVVGPELSPHEREQLADIVRTGGEAEEPADN
jgi:predicted transcriptional regulator